MRTSRFVLVTLAIVCVSPQIGYAHKPDSVDLRLRLKKGDSFNIKSISKGETTNEINGKALTFLVTTTTEYQAIVDTVREDGITLMHVQVTRFALSIRSDKMTLLLDTKDSSKTSGSTRTANEVAHESYGKASRLIGTTFWMELNDRAETLRTNIDTVFDMRDDMGETVCGSTKTAFQMTTFAGYPVKVGETWKGIRTQNKEGKVLSEYAHYTLTALHGTTASVRSVGEGGGDMPDANAHATYTGEQKVDVKSGVSVKSHYTMQIRAEQTSGTLASKLDITTSFVKE